MAPRRSPRSHDCRRSQKLPKNGLEGRRFPAKLWVIDIFQDVAGGRNRARTWDPLIKSQLIIQYCQGSFRQILGTYPYWTETEISFCRNGKCLLISRRKIRFRAQMLEIVGPNLRADTQDAANSSRFLAAKSRLRAVRDGMVAEGEELQTNLLQANQRIPANSSVPDEVFGIHTGLAGEEVQMAPSAARFPCGQGTLQKSWQIP